MSIKLKPQIEDFILTLDDDTPTFKTHTFVYKPCNQYNTVGFERIIKEELIRRKIKNQIGLLGQNPSKIKNVIIDFYQLEGLEVKIQRYTFDVVYPNESYTFVLHIINNDKIENPNEFQLWKVTYFVIFIGKYSNH